MLVMSWRTARPVCTVTIPARLFRTATNAAMATTATPNNMKTSFFLFTTISLNYLDVTHGLEFDNTILPSPIFVQCQRERPSHNLRRYEFSILYKSKFRARANTSRSIAAVSLPVEVFCWLG